MCYTLQLTSINKYYCLKKTFPVLLNVNINIIKGQIVALIGASGSGKSTLLQIAGLLDKPTSGKVIINNVECATANDNQKTLLRRNFLGFIYQFHHLLQELSVLENVLLPQLIKGTSLSIAKKNAYSILEQVGLHDKQNSLVSNLSGGERQRVAIARGLVNCPLILLADEPTGSLDPKTSAIIFSLIHKYVKEKNISALIVTHNHKLVQSVDSIIQLESHTTHIIK
ncbi:ABC transporter ATP-binding protein [Neoehrlichia mikurensis]|uniref:ABC transporter ATP-binding protein n=1 Tax=Neoehrlichia mikurensis TaxID=89586 RepID=A0A9Q9BWV5_9RICK|nr:ABC transporter ATP-binding protein [Neoehrlichia mikurensis]QXK92226.1 ABC transporter ATP-binding protein [Neoehrlichia mikurensis]QXK92681.1 ABC transporter ATP-binding protein [Neoehrlichia mikurensis]QXK93919.1 ABC transporter ATP-binding protein [Neoehrlichia mikurensis]UTO55078.1 ABC transporter ATP-binding protein [Neoehrlichia mikurensis]UTO55997.1 ABC transporter ATP-binding protein [Neoehrlichia mikurensis]